MDKLSTSQSPDRANLGHLHWYHWGVFLLSLVVTFGAWYYAKSQIEDKLNERFNREANKTIELITERMEKYEDVLWSGAGLFYASNYVSFEEWRSFAKAISIEKKYPGINGIGFIFYVKPNQVNDFIEKQTASNPNFKIYPKHQKDIFMPITYIEPFAENAKAVGLDMAHESNRYQAAIKAKQTGLAQITGPITLVQDEAKTPGFLFYVPVYKGETQDTQVESNFYGLVYAPFVVKKLMEGALSREGRHVTITLADGDTQLYTEQIPMTSDAKLQGEDAIHYDPNPLFTKKGVIEFYGRQWDYALHSDLGFRASAANNQPYTILFGGLTIDSLLLYLFFLLARTNKKATDYADHATAKLIEKTDKLQKSNKELEQFAYIASHDLKAPLRGIDNLISWIIEDADELDGQTKDNLARVKIRIARMENLIKGILEYSKVNQCKKNGSLIDTQEVFNEVKEQYNDSKTNHIIIKGDMPLIKGSDLRFKQVVSNLISNAIKYNDKQQPTIEVYFIQKGDFVEFTFKDNGPGIDKQYHQKIFELFQTLKPKDEFESTGVGLSIVKKIIEENGGKIWADSTPGHGAKFHFQWPVDKTGGQA